MINMKTRATSICQPAKQIAYIKPKTNKHIPSSSTSSLPKSTPNSFSSGSAFSLNVNQPQQSGLSVMNSKSSIPGSFNSIPQSQNGFNLMAQTKPIGTAAAATSQTSNASSFNLGGQQNQSPKIQFPTLGSQQQLQPPSQQQQPINFSIAKPQPQVQPQQLQQAQLQQQQQSAAPQVKLYQQPALPQQQSFNQIQSPVAQMPQQQQQQQQQQPPKPVQTQQSIQLSGALDQFNQFKKEIEEFKNTASKFNGGKDITKYVIDTNVIKQTKISYETVYTQLCDDMNAMNEACMSLREDLLTSMHNIEKFKSLKAQLFKKGNEFKSSATLDLEIDPMAKQRFENMKKLYMYLITELPNMRTYLIEYNQRKQGKIASSISSEKIFKTIQFIEITINNNTKNINKLIAQLKSSKFDQSRLALSDLSLNTSNYSPRAKVDQLTTMLADSRIGGGANESDYDNENMSPFVKSSSKKSFISKHGQVIPNRFLGYNSPSKPFKPDEDEEDEEAVKLKVNATIEKNIKFYTKLYNLLKKRHVSQTNQLTKQAVPTQEIDLNQIRFLDSSKLVSMDKSSKDKQQVLTGFKQVSTPQQTQQAQVHHHHHHQQQQQQQQQMLQPKSQISVQQTIQPQSQPAQQPQQPQLTIKTQPQQINLAFEMQKQQTQPFTSIQQQNSQAQQKPTQQSSGSPLKQNLFVNLNQQQPQQQLPVSQPKQQPQPQAQQQPQQQQQQVPKLVVPTPAQTQQAQQPAPTAQSKSNIPLMVNKPVQPPQTVVQSQSNPVTLSSTSGTTSSLFNLSGSATSTPFNLGGAISKQQTTTAVTTATTTNTTTQQQSSATTPKNLFSTVDATKTAPTSSGSLFGTQNAGGLSNIKFGSGSTSIFGSTSSITTTQPVSTSENKVPSFSFNFSASTSTQSIPKSDQQSDNEPVTAPKPSTLEAQKNEVKQPIQVQESDIQKTETKSTEATDKTTKQAEQQKSETSADQSKAAEKEASTSTPSKPIFGSTLSTNLFGGTGTNTSGVFSFGSATKSLFGTPQPQEAPKTAASGSDTTQKPVESKLKEANETKNTSAEVKKPDAQPTQTPTTLPTSLSTFGSVGSSILGEAKPVFGTSSLLGDNKPKFGFGSLTTSASTSNTSISGSTATTSTNPLVPSVGTGLFSTLVAKKDENSTPTQNPFSALTASKPPQSTNNELDMMADSDAGNGANAMPTFGGLSFGTQKTDSNTPNKSSVFGGSLFNSFQQQPQQQQQSSLFGSSPNANAGIIKTATFTFGAGGAAAPASQPSQPLTFGSSQPQTTNTGGGLFGATSSSNTAASQASTGGSLFSSFKTPQKSTGFGATATFGAPAAFGSSTPSAFGGQAVFGGQPTFGGSINQTTSPSGGLFGSFSTASSAAAPTGNLFGGATSQSIGFDSLANKPAFGQPTGFGAFGQQAQQQQQQQQPPSFGGGFGAQSSQNQGSGGFASPPSSFTAYRK